MTRKVYILEEKRKYVFDPDVIDDMPPMRFVGEDELKKYEADYNIVDVIEVKDNKNGKK